MTWRYSKDQTRENLARWWDEYCRCVRRWWSR